MMNQLMSWIMILKIKEINITYYWTVIGKTHPSGIGMNRAMMWTSPEFIEKLGNRYSKEQCESSDDKISHRVHVCKLKKW